MSLDRGVSTARATATKLGLSESHVRSLLKRGLRIA
ncbi:hypothetical protein kac65v162_gp006 [Nodularia phage vB_NspS-kac65v162]|uniref:Uncharacterized protein n=3 Tax=Ravarandavirus kac65v151 TaxID=2845689 RepID=A0A482MHG8_9CAUD|nr:hypothetical protein HWC12_gp006 [Nodularia phage vB_NspS-kac65v151]QBQ73038.1 hypothetical protein kac65v151_gp006 [Nodularia phage vB_NspS-kac65v151]QBQ73244.1 hypothetical protein kac65v161_gp006 [Nodularia phage vB_NspS-kac65v161]QBQ73450.1 hypothetical protein kac65v162_gp006 [Nodularia phage vB_NspS-kac65v162]